MSISGITLTTRFDPVLAEEGLRLLPAAKRKLHPRAQVQTLRRIAVRAIKHADWLLELAARDDAIQGDSDWTPEQQASARLAAAGRRLEAPPYYAKAEAAAAAMCRLNAEHGLGY